jgi:hypothetical protein
MKSELSEVQKQLNAVISNIKGGDDLKRLSQKQILANNDKLKAGISAGTVSVTGSVTTTTQAQSTATSSIIPTPPVQKSVNPDILTDAEVQRLQNLVATIEASPNAKDLVNTRQYLTAKEKLRKNAVARLAAGM